MPKNDSNIDQKIQDRVEQFTADLAELIREAALEAVREALGADSTAAAAGGATRRSAQPRGAKKRSSKKRATKKRAAKQRATKARGGKRRGAKAGRPRRQSDARVTELSAAVVGALQSQPQQSISDLATQIGVASADLKRPIADLLEAKQIKKKGQRRGTRYSAA